MSKIDSEFSNYQDDTMKSLYRKYAEKYRNEI